MPLAGSMGGPSGWGVKVCWGVSVRGALSEMRSSSLSFIGVSKMRSKSRAWFFSSAPCCAWTASAVGSVCWSFVAFCACLSFHSLMAILAGA